MMESIKIFTEAGEKEFANFLINLKYNPSLTKIDLNERKYVSELTNGVQLDSCLKFASRLELAVYLATTLERNYISLHTIKLENRIWTWMTYLWFDQICPIINGERKVRQMARYICEAEYRTYYRHFIASSYSIYNLHGKEYSKLFLETPLYIHNDFIEQIASRQEIISQPNLIKVIHTLYWNNISGRPKPSALDRQKPGNLRRLLKLFSQIELTYDIYSLQAEEIIRLLPIEFNCWRTPE